MPDEAEYVPRRTNGEHGINGASLMERLPIEGALTEQVRYYKRIRFAWR